MRFFTFLLSLVLGIGLSFVYTLNDPSMAFAGTITITGKVTDEQGQAIANIRVSVSLGGFENASALTNANGIYTLTNVDSATDPTGAVLVGYIHFADTVTPPRYASEYYKDASTVQNATVVYTGGQSTVTVNAQLAPLAQISGQVSDMAGQPANNVTITAYQQVTVGGVAQWVSVNNATSDNNGHYTMTALPAGTYRIGYHDDSGLRRYATEYYADAARLETAVDITLATGATVTNINAQLAARGGISGLVTNKSGQPAPGISINLYTYEQTANGGGWGAPYSITQTDQAGHYTINGLDRGKYRIAFVDYYPPVDYLPQFYKEAATLESATDIQIEPATLVSNVNAELATKGQITGRIVDGQGKPLANYIIDTYRFDSFTKSWSQAEYGGVSDATGAYTITRVLPGVYRIGFFDNYWPRRYLPQYYKNVAKVDNGTDVMVQADAVTSGIDAQVAPIGHITGRVIDETGHGIDKVEVAVYAYVPYPSGGGAWQPVQPYMHDPLQATTDVTGAYDLPGLEPDTYRLSFVDPLNRYLPEYYNNATTIDSATDVIVQASATVIGVDAQLATVGRITGNVTDLNDQPLSNLTVIAMQSGTGAQVAQGVTDSAGNYTITGLPQGVYRVLFNAYGRTMPTPYVPLYYDKATTFANATDIQVHLGETISNINAKLAARGRITGKITNLAGETVKDVRVTIYQQNPGSTAWFAFLTTLTDGQGGYAVGGLDPAKYRVGFMDEEIFTGLRYVPEYYNHVFTFEAAADIEVSLNQTLTINAQLTPRSHITGTVTSEDSGPLIDVQVLAWRFKSEVNAWQIERGANLDEAGHYDLSGLEPDHYRIQFFSYDSQRYRGEYYDDVLTLEQAKDIPVGLNETVGNINAQLALSKPTDHPVARFTFTKTVGIAGITPLCTAQTELKVPVNTPIVYCYTIQNTSNVTLTTHTLQDSHLGLLLNAVSIALAPGQSYSTTFTQTLTVSTTNVATWTATTGQQINAAAADRAGAATAQGQTTTASTAATVIISSATDDQDQDGIPDNVEGAGDVDRDNAPNFLDLDSDGDGLADAVEVGPDVTHPRDSDRDGTPDFLEQNKSLNPQQIFLPMVQR